MVDVRNPLPWDDNSADLIYHSHLIEHLSFEQAVAFLKECHRILKPGDSGGASGGLMRVTTPDLDIFLEHFRAFKSPHTMDDFDDAQPDIYRDRSQSMKFSMIVFGNMGYVQEHYQGHFMIYNEESLTELLQMAGFRDVKRMDCMERGFVAEPLRVARQLRVSGHDVLTTQDMEENEISCYTQSDVMFREVYDVWPDHTLCMEAIK